jgi:hypothetical protein
LVDNRALEMLTQLETDSYARGMADALAAVRAALDQIAAGSKAMPVRKADPEQSAAILTAAEKSQENKPRFRANSDVGRVFDEICKHPGNRGFQLQALLAMSGSVVNERTMRTALNRLKKRGYVEQRAEGAWFPTREYETNPGQLL